MCSPGTRRRSRRVGALVGLGGFPSPFQAPHVYPAGWLPGKAGGVAPCGCSHATVSWEFCQPVWPGTWKIGINSCIAWHLSVPGLVDRSNLARPREGLTA